MKKSKSTWNMTAGLFGNSLEWYDFILYAYFAPLFASLFFPAEDQFLSLISTFGIFASGFLVRPIGGLLIGRYADHAGRQKALVVSITIMTIATLLIACLPTFAQVGIWGPIFLTLLRLLQGIAVGGELTSSATFLIEHAPVRWQGLVGSLLLCTAFIGMLFGSATATFISAQLSAAHFLQWGWRIGYLIGGLLGLVGIYLRMKCEESPVFLKIAKQAASPAMNILKFHRKELFVAIIFTSILAIGNYILIAYVTTYLVRFEKFSYEDAMLINFFSLLLLSILIPAFGLLADRKDTKTVFWIGIGSSLVFAFPIFWLLTIGQFSKALLGQLLLSLILAPLNAVVPLILVQMFPTEVRATGSAIAYNLSQAVFGGTAPLFSLLLVEWTGNKYAPGGYYFICALIAAFVLFAYKRGAEGRVKLDYSHH